jgi:hypothetical protein
MIRTVTIWRMSLKEQRVMWPHPPCQDNCWFYQVHSSSSGSWRIVWITVRGFLVLCVCVCVCRHDIDQSIYKTLSYIYTHIHIYIHTFKMYRYINHYVHIYTYACLYTYRKNVQRNL